MCVCVCVCQPRPTYDTATTINAATIRLPHASPAKLLSSPPLSPVPSPLSVPSPNHGAPAASCFSSKVSNEDACGYSNNGVPSNGHGIEDCRVACRKNSACTGHVRVWIRVRLG